MKIVRKAIDYKLVGESLVDNNFAWTRGLLMTSLLLRT